MPDKDIRAIETPRESSAAPRRATKTSAPVPERKTVDEFISLQKIPAWKAASILVFARWKSGKMVTAEEFEKAVKGWEKRPQGGGRKKI